MQLNELRTMSYALCKVKWNKHLPLPLSYTIRFWILTKGPFLHNGNNTVYTCTYKLIVLLMVIDWFGTNFCSKGVLWLALRGQPLPLICAAAIAILSYTLIRRYIFDVTNPTTYTTWSVPTTTFDHQTNHGYPSTI